MPAERVLIEILTTANMSGVAEAKASFLGLGVSTLALTAGIGGLAMAGKSAIEITEAHEQAERGLAQAFTVSGNNADYARKELDQFIQSNRSHISSQTDAIESFAKLTRAGLTEDKVMRDMNIALDLSKLKHISLNEATDLVTKAEEGHFRGLVGLGIQTKHITNDMGDQVKGAEAVNEIMEELAAKTDKARDSDTQMSQATNRLHNDWEDLATKGGPPLIGMMSSIAEGADQVYSAMERFGKNDAWWKGLNDGLITVSRSAQALAFAIGAIPNISSGSGIQGIIDWANPLHGNQRAAGGPVLPGGVYTVGERGPETLVMGARGGRVIPGGGGGQRSGNTYNLTLYGSGAADDPEGVRRMLMRMQLMGTAG